MSDVLAILNGGEFVSAEPLPPGLLAAARVVARDFGLLPDWLNAGPASLLDFGLPEGFLQRAQHYPSEGYRTELLELLTHLGASCGSDCI